MVRKLIYSIFLASGFLIAQSNDFNLEVEFDKFTERGGKVEELSPNIYKLTYIDGTQRVFNLNSATDQNTYNEDFDTTIINVWEIDTTLYAYKFKFWQKVILTNSNQVRVPIEDINQNGLLEMYGRTRVTFPLGGQVDILEQNGQGIFQTVYSYDSTSIVIQAVGDINSDGTKEVYLRTSDTLSGKFYKADSLGAFPTSFDFIFYHTTTAQINEMTFGDFDKNGITDCAFQDWSIFIATYNSSINNFYEVDQFNFNNSAAGFAIGDFDEDEKTDLVLGVGSQNIYLIEAEDTNLYSIVWRGQAPSVNPWMLTSTNDIDGNGKTEFWIGGQDFTTGISTFWCFESDGNNSYIPVAGIELRYLVSLFSDYLQAVDVNNDRKEELVIDMGNYLLILKFTGKPNQHSYEIFFAKIGEATQPSAIFCPSTIYDMNDDGMKDILLAMDVYPEPDFSYILVQDTLTSVTDEGLLVWNEYILSQNYPNPFNPITKIKYSIPQSRFVVLQVYDILGNEIETLVNEEKPYGVYEVEFNAKDLSSGIYFYQLSAGDFISTKKLVLLK